MVLLLLLAIILSTPSPRVLLNNTTDFSANFHEKCEEMVPKNSAARVSLAALVCGTNMQASPLQKDLLRSSLIHAYVVSGSHLILLDQFFGIFGIPLIVRFLILLLYSFSAGWQAPVVRALSGWLLLSTKSKFKIFIPTDLCVAIAGMICLILFPDWWGSLSLILSWCAALALSSVGLFRWRSQFSKIFFTQIVVFVFMCLPLWGWGNLHPLSVVFNLMLIPFISFVLLPLAVLSFLFHPLLFLFEHSENLFSWILAHDTEPVISTKSAALPVSWIWLWILFLHLVIHFVRLKKRQGRDLG
jgi:ComEC/Rec2-related protein